MDCGEKSALTEAVATKCSLYKAIHDRYSYDVTELGDSLKSFTLIFDSNKVSRTNGSFTDATSAMLPVATATTNSDKTTTTTTTTVVESSEVKVEVVGSPRKLNINSYAIVLSDKNISWIGTSEEMAELAEICPNLCDLDLSRNTFENWAEIKNLLDTFKNLKFLNLRSNSNLASQNPANNNQISPTNNPSEISPTTVDIDYFAQHWPQPTTLDPHRLSTLILNACFINYQTIELLLERLPNLDELYLASNKYSHVEFSATFVNSKLRVLYFNDNSIDDWNEIVKIGRAFPQLESLVLSENPIAAVKTSGEVFKNLKLLVLNKLPLSDWSDLDLVRNEFVGLKHLKVQNIPLLDELKSKDERFFMLVATLGNDVDHLNGSTVSHKEKDTSQRKFIRYFMDKPELTKPARYFELEKKHGKLSKLAEVNYDTNLVANVKIRVDEKNYYDKIETRQTVGKLKKYLEKYAECTSDKFRLFYYDSQTSEALGPDEMNLMNISLGRYHIKDGDEFVIDLKSKSNNWNDKKIIK